MFDIPRIRKERKRARLILGMIFGFLLLGIAVVLLTQTGISAEILISTVIIGGTLTLISMIPSYRADADFLLPFISLIALIFAAILIVLRGSVR